MRYRTTVAISALLALASCQRSAPQQQTTTPTPAATASVKPPPVVVSAPAAATEEIGHFAENLYDWGLQGDWAKAEADLTALDRAVTQLEKTGQVTDLRGARTILGTIGKAVAAHQPRPLMHAANEMTRVAAEISRQFNPQVPVEVVLLDFYGRELQLWAMEGDASKLNETRSKLQQTWDVVRPAVVAKGGTTEAAQFDALVGKLTQAKAPKDFTAAATPILDSVDALENVFTRA
jgi:hypothetical protein